MIFKHCIATTSFLAFSRQLVCNQPALVKSNAGHSNLTESLCLNNAKILRKSHRYIDQRRTWFFPDTWGLIVLRTINSNYWGHYSKCYPDTYNLRLDSWLQDPIGCMHPTTPLLLGISDLKNMSGLALISNRIEWSQWCKLHASSITQLGTINIYSLRMAIQ